MSYKVIYSRSWIVPAKNGMESESATIERTFEVSVPLKDAFGAIKMDMEQAREGYLMELDIKVSGELKSKKLAGLESELAKLGTDIIRYQEFYTQSDMDRDTYAKQSYGAKITTSQKRIEELKAQIAGLDKGGKSGG